MLTTGGELLTLAPADLDGAAHLFGGDSAFVDSIVQTVDSTSTSLAQVQASNVPSLYISKEEVHKPMIADEIMGHNYDPFSALDMGMKKTTYSSLDALYGNYPLLLFVLYFTCFYTYTWCIYIIASVLPSAKRARGDFGPLPIYNDDSVPLDGDAISDLLLPSYLSSPIIDQGKAHSYTHIYKCDAEYILYYAYICIYTEQSFVETDDKLFQSDLSHVQAFFNKSFLQSTQTGHNSDLSVDVIGTSDKVTAVKKGKKTKK